MIYLLRVSVKKKKVLRLVTMLEHSPCWPNEASPFRRNVCFFMVPTSKQLIATGHCSRICPSSVYCTMDQIDLFPFTHLDLQLGDYIHVLLPKRCTNLNGNFWNGNTNIVCPIHTVDWWSVFLGTIPVVLALTYVSSRCLYAFLVGDHHG